MWFRCAFRPSASVPLRAPQVRVPRQAFRAAIALASVLCLGVAGCSVVSRATGVTTKKEAQAEAAAKAENFQIATMRFADEFVDRITRGADTLAEQLPDPRTQSEILDWQLSQATAAVQIASGPKPSAAAVDMVVLVSLSRRIVERDWPARYGEPAQAILATYQGLEQGAWHLIAEASAEQRAGLDGLLVAWVKNNPQVRNPSFVRFADFASGADKSRVVAIPGLLGFVGLDPLSGLDPAVQEVSRSRQLAERAVYYMQRAPQLLALQGRLLAAQTRLAPETREVLDTFTHVNRLSDSLTRFTDNAPALISQQRDAAIAQFMGELAQQQKQMEGLATQLRQALEAGHGTADSLHALIQSTDRMLARFAPNPNAPAPGGLRRPFDINDYTRTAVELAATSRELRSLVRDVDASTPQLSRQLDALSARVEGLIGYAFWRLVLLVLVVLAAAIAYRVATHRLARPAT